MIEADSYICTKFLEIVTVAFSSEVKLSEFRVNFTNFWNANLRISRRSGEGVWRGCAWPPWSINMEQPEQETSFTVGRYENRADYSKWRQKHIFDTNGLGFVVDIIEKLEYHLRVQVLWDREALCPSCPKKEHCHPRWYKPCSSYIKFVFNWILTWHRPVPKYLQFSCQRNQVYVPWFLFDFADWSTGLVYTILHQFARCLIGQYFRPKWRLRRWLKVQHRACFQSLFWRWIRRVGAAPTQA